MRIGHLAAVTLAGCSLAAAQDGWCCPESPGIVTAGDFNGDGCDDVLVFGVRGANQTYYGQKTRPYFRKGPNWYWAGFLVLGDAPVFVGQHLYMPCRTDWNGVGEIRVYSHQGGVWTQKKSIYLPTSSQSGYVSSLKIAPLGKDIDNDKLEDIIVVWAQRPLTSSHAYYAAYVSPSGLSNQLDIPKLKGHHDQALIADVHATHSVSNPRFQFLVTLSAPHQAVAGGFGFLVLNDGPTAGKTIWAHGPPLDNGGLSPSNSAAAYGHFGLLPQLGAPLVKLDRGESILFEPWFIAPYVHDKGEVLYSAHTGTILDSCTADYDGDGVDEIVLIEQFGIWKPSLLYIGDPSSKRPYVQALNLWTDRSYTSPYVFHGTKGDFNGDGRLDLVLSYSRAEHGKEIGYFALFVGKNEDGPGRAALRRIY
jgi:hypothetical protein